MCSFREPQAGTNAAFSIPVDELQVPGQRAVVPNAPVLPEVWIERRVSHDDPAPYGMAVDLTDIARFHELSETMRSPHGSRSALRTRLGGVPCRTGNGPVDPPQRPFRFLMQIDKHLTVRGPEEGSVDLANLCSDGTGVVFVDPDHATLPCLFLVNR